MWLLWNSLILLWDSLFAQTWSLRRHLILGWLIYEPANGHSLVSLLFLNRIVPLSIHLLRASREAAVVRRLTLRYHLLLMVEIRSTRLLALGYGGLKAALAVHRFVLQSSSLISQNSWLNRRGHPCRRIWWLSQLIGRLERVWSEPLLRWILAHILILARSDRPSSRRLLGELWALRLLLFAIERWQL